MQPKTRPTSKTATLLSRAARRFQDELKGKDNVKLSPADTPKETTATVVLSKKKPVMNGSSVMGTAVSGPFKNPQKRFSSVVKTKGLKKTFAERMALREDQKRIKQKHDALKEAYYEEQREERRRLEQRKKMKEENEKKSAVVQRISNTKKLKKLTPKQMRYIVKM